MASNLRLRGPSFALVVLGLTSACFDPDVRRQDTMADPTTTGPIAGSTGPGATSTVPEDTGEITATSDASTGEAATTSPLDGTSTGDASTDDGSTSGGSTGDASTGELTAGESSSSTGGMACVPGPALVEFESLGNFISQGDGWQSFTAAHDGDIVEVDFYWNLSGTNDSFTMNIYQGEGTGGTLLYSELFPGQGMGTFVGFDVNLLSAPVTIEAGQVYTVQGVDTFGWQTANGAIAGSASSFGVGQHKNIRVWVEPCN